MKTKYLLLILAITLAISGCKKDETNEMYVLGQLYKTFQNGEISECTYNSQMVYCAGLNAYDAGCDIYDKMGNQIANCDYAWGSVDPICEQISGCEVIYRVEDNIWGLPAIDKYHLGNK